MNEMKLPEGKVTAYDLSSDWLRSNRPIVKWIQPIADRINTDDDTIADLRAKLSAYEEREKQGVVDVEKYLTLPAPPFYLDKSLSEKITLAWNAARIGWEPKRDPSEWLCVKRPEGADYARVEWHGEMNIISQIVNLPTPQPTLNELRAKRRADLQAQLDAVETMTEEELKGVKS